MLLFLMLMEPCMTFSQQSIGISYNAAQLARIMEKYLFLDPYPETLSTLDALQGRPLGILSNGNQEILDALATNTNVADKLDQIISIDRVGVFKPNADAYALVEKLLGVQPAKTVFVSSNAFDACAAKNFGFQVAWIERVTTSALSAEIAASDIVGPSTLFKILRMQMENFDMEPDVRLKSLSDLIAL